MFEKEAEEYEDNAEYIEIDDYGHKVYGWYEIEQAYQKGAEVGYNKGKEDVKYESMMKLKDEGIVKLLKDSILRNERLSSQEQQELCAWIECAMDFGENLDECAKELEQIRNERNLFQEKCEDIELNYYCDKLECRFLSRNKWHYVKDGLPKELHDVLCFIIHNEHRYVLQGYIRDGRWVLSPLGTYLNNEDVIAWKEIVLPEPLKYWDLSTGENNINKESE